jgi:uncharacterized membrane protein YsdA (DUF1294 family)
VTPADQPKPGRALATAIWFALFAIAAAGACAMAVERGGVVWVALACVACLNVFAFALYAFDKYAARRGGRRVPERVLLGAALLGGTPAVLVAGLVTRHKTAKRSFRLLFALNVLIQLAALGWAGIY